MAGTGNGTGLRDLGDGIFAYFQRDGSWGWSNAGLIADDGEALLVDTFFDFPTTRAMLDGFAHATPAARNIRLLVNTHQNGDHCFGNALVEDAEIIATEAATLGMTHESPAVLASLMKAAPGMGLTGEFFIHCFGAFDFGGVRMKHPDTTFTGRMTRHVGAKRVEIIEVGPAHTGGDALVYVPGDRTIFTGDILFIGGHPVMWAGPVANWIAACETILGLDVEKVVPGHGPLTGKAGVIEVRDYLIHIRDAARARFDAGMPAFDAAREIASTDSSGRGDCERIAVNVASLYREFGAADVPSDPATLFGWMAQLWKDRKR